jgi:hypothetical protein
LVSIIFHLLDMRLFTKRWIRPYIYLSKLLLMLTVKTAPTRCKFSSNQFCLENIFYAYHQGSEEAKTSSQSTIIKKALNLILWCCFSMFIYFHLKQYCTLIRWSIIIFSNLFHLIFIFPIFLENYVWIDTMHQHIFSASSRANSREPIIEDGGTSSPQLRADSSARPRSSQALKGNFILIACDRAKSQF